jgi:hypothetical protein
VTLALWIFIAVVVACVVLLLKWMTDDWHDEGGNLK